MKSKLKRAGATAAIVGSGVALSLGIAAPAGAVTTHNGAIQSYHHKGICMPVGALGGLGAAALASGAFVFRMRRRSATA